MIPFETNPNRDGQEAYRPPLRRVRLKSKITTGLVNQTSKESSGAVAYYTDTPEVWKARDFNGTHEGPKDIIVRILSGKKIGEEAYVYAPLGGAGVTYQIGSRPARQVKWIEAAGGGIPKPTAKYQVYTPVDDTLIPVWTGARFK